MINYTKSNDINKHREYYFFNYKNMVICHFYGGNCKRYVYKHRYIDYKQNGIDLNKFNK